MKYSSITVLKGTTKKADTYKDSLVVTFEEIKEWIVKGIFIMHILRYREAKLVTYNLDFTSKPLLNAVLLRMMSRGSCYIEDEFGQRKGVTARLILRILWQLVRDGCKKRFLLYRVYRETNQIMNSDYKIAGITCDNPVYLRTDFNFGVRSGGSVGHIAGVLNNMDFFLGKPIFITSDFIPTVRSDIELHIIPPGKSFWDFKELPTVYYNDVFFKKASLILKNRRISFIYQRYSVNNYAGVKLALLFGIPFVLEYNGSEVWVSKHWGIPLKYGDLSERIELLNLKSANLIVVVSQALKNELVGRGINPEKIIVNPNGVDPERYLPEVDGTNIRKKYGILGKVVVGFIGTFGRWHGAELLADAYGLLINEFPEYRERVRLLMIGDGLTLPDVKKRLDRNGAMEKSILTGLVSQEKGPEYMAACDILILPHIPNPDGSAFFGSPTKLFEYMAMGKGIVASDLGQIGEVLEHGITAWMVTPGNVESLIIGLKMLVDNEKLRTNLGRNARREVIEKYTWHEHTKKIAEKINKTSSGY